MKKTSIADSKFAYKKSSKDIVQLCSSTKVDCFPITSVGAALLRDKSIILVPLMETPVQSSELRVVHLVIAPTWKTVSLGDISSAAIKMKLFNVKRCCSKIYLGIRPQGLTTSAEEKLDQLDASLNFIFEKVPLGKRPLRAAFRMVQNHHDSRHGPSAWINSEKAGLDHPTQYAMALEAARVGAERQLDEYHRTPKLYAADVLARLKLTQEGQA